MFGSKNRGDPKFSQILQIGQFDVNAGAIEREFGKVLRKGGEFVVIAAVQRRDAQEIGRGFFPRG